MLTDTHAHLTFPEFANDLPGILARADAAGVKRVITIGTTLESSTRAVALAEQYPNVWATVGLHPGNVDEAAMDTLPALRALADHPRVLAIGEIGLDYHWLPGAVAQRAGKIDAGNAEALAVEDARTKQLQSEAFTAQLRMAVELGLNVVIHQRSAWEPVLEHVRGAGEGFRAVWHCFTEAPERAAEIFALGHLVSFTGIVTFKNAGDLHRSVAKAPADRFMVETDAPYLAPVPHRGKTCEPAYTRITAEEVARLRGAPLEEFATQTEATADAFFWRKRQR